MNREIRQKPAENGREIRTYSNLPVEVRAGEGNTVKVAGYAAVFDQITEIGGWYREVVRRGAFTQALERRDDAQFLIEHSGLPLARVASGTLQLRQDNKGLFMESTLDANDPDVARIVPKMQRGDLSKMSFAFSIYPDGESRWIEEGDQDLELREIVRVGRLYDVAIVGEPAYSGTEIGLRSLEQFRAERGNPLADENANAAARLRLKMRAAALIHRSHP